MGEFIFKFRVSCIGKMKCSLKRYCDNHYITTIEFVDG